MEDVELQIEAALEAGRAATASVRAMPGSQDRADAAVRLSKGLRAVSEDASAVLHEEAIRIYYTTTHNLAEGAGAAPLAALLKENNRYAGKRVGLILSGGNIDMAVFAQILRGETPSV